ncbi:glycoside hydrolase family 15 protein [Pigmentiphaga soli]|uniref:Glycoside hydrolase family 15 protein n=1 Tax=Pigmentiphaga soli TaxID=1007095 RepID=A0ABP8GXP2_9BURK
MQSRIEDYAVVGNGRSAALIGSNGSIDWLCWPRFDSDACFASLLGTADNGYWKIGPAADGATVSRRYVDDTLILETRFATADGEVALIDFMPAEDQRPELVRIVRGLSGEVAMRMDFVVRFGYGALVPWVTRLEEGEGIRAVVGPDMVVLRTTVPLRNESLHTDSEFAVRAGEQAVFTLSYGRSYRPVPVARDAARLLAGTQTAWRDWSARSRAHGEYRDAIQRSLITLKALAFVPTGGIVAAVTTSLPETLGGDRNWDYRYCWLRDATLTLRALMRGGYFGEAARWRDWLVRAVAGAPEQLQVMYGVAGERRLQEWECGWLSGYEGARPVRIGNAAADQLQLDVYGEVMNTLHEARIGGLPDDPAAWALQVALVGHLEKIWRVPDEGIWETRGGRRLFTFSKVMCWVAVDRTIQSAELFGLEGPLDRWRLLRDEIHRDVCERGFNARRNAFVQHYGSDDLDASLLLMAPVGFLPADDPRVVATVAAIERELVSDGLVLRYKTETMHDGLDQGEGTFLACSFWLVENLSLQGRQAEAEELFARLLALRNDVGLLAEEYDTHARRQVGNFPQAFSHTALVDTAFNLLKRRSASPQG